MKVEDLAVRGATMRVRAVGLNRGFALVLLLGAVCTPSGNTPAAEAATTKTADNAVTNATNFHLLDFVGWNNRDMDVFRRLHTADVKVELGDTKTEGIEAHVAGVRPPTPATLDRRIVQHSPIVADGDWTCVVGISVRNDKLVTAAKWRDGAISEEYILTNQLKPGTPKPTISGAPMITISNQNANLKREVGAEPGWSCTMGRTADGKAVISLTKRNDAATADELTFTQ
jgi:hypothetical protein